MAVLTLRQREILIFIQRFIAENQFPPALRDIMEEFGFRSTNGANDHVQALINKGYISRQPVISRSIRVLVPIEAHAS